MKDTSVIRINEFLNELPHVNLISLSREKVTLTFAALDVRHVLQERVGNVNCNAKMVKVGMNTKLVFMLSL